MIIIMITLNVRAQAIPAFVTRRLLAKSEDFNIICWLDAHACCVSILRLPTTIVLACARACEAVWAHAAVATAAVAEKPATRLVSG